MKKNNIGIDIGLYSIKCAVLEKVNDAYVIKQKETYRLPQGEEVNSDFIEESLIDFTKEYGIRRVNLHFSIPFMSPEVQFRFFDMPKLPPKELEKAIKYKIEGSTLSNFDSIYYKWSIMPKDEEEYRVLAVSIYQDLVHEIKKIKKAGWKIVRIEPQIVSLGRLVKKDSAVIDLGYRGTRLIVYRDGFPVFIDTIDIGGKSFTESISRRYPDQSEDIKHEFGAVIPDTSIESNPNVLAVADLVFNTAKDLAMEVKQSLRVAEVEQGIEFDKIYYTGNGASLRYLTDYLSAETGYELIPLGLSLEEDYPYAIASGASLGIKYLEDINFGKVTIKRKYDPLKTIFMILGIAAAIQLGVYHLNVETSKNLEEIILKNSDIRASILNTEENIRMTQNEIQKYREIEASLERIQGRRTINSNILYELPKRVPESISLDGIDMKSREMTISGKYESYSDIGVFAIALEEIGEVNIETLGTDNFIIKFKPDNILVEFNPDPEETK